MKEREAEAERRLTEVCELRAEARKRGVVALNRESLMKQEAEQEVRPASYRDPFYSAPLYYRDPVPSAPLYFMEISRNCTRILSDARAVASASVTAPVFYGNFAKIQWRPTLRYPTARASKAHRPTSKLNLQNLLN